MLKDLIYYLNKVVAAILVFLITWVIDSAHLSPKTIRGAFLKHKSSLLRVVMDHILL